jgi:hypothetical protein
MYVEEQLERCEQWRDDIARRAQKTVDVYWAAMRQGNAAQDTRPESERAKAFLGVSMHAGETLRIAWFRSATRKPRGKQTQKILRTNIRKGPGHMVALAELKRQSPRWLHPMVVAAEREFAALREEWRTATLLRKRLKEIGREIEQKIQRARERETLREGTLRAALFETLGIEEPNTRERPPEEGNELDYGPLRPQVSIDAER